VTLALVVVAACSSSPVSTDATTSTRTRFTFPSAARTALSCREVFVDGRAVSEEQWMSGCNDDEGTVVAATGYDCIDGRRFFVSRLGWGYAGQPFHVAPASPGSPGSAGAGTPANEEQRRCLTPPPATG
jgi:hypothetical protein